MHFDPEAFGAAMGELIVEAVAPLKERIADLERQLADRPDVAAIVAEQVADAVAKAPAPSNGKDADMDAVRVMIDEAVSRIPAPSNGKDADPEFVRSMVREAVDALPSPQDGKSITVEDVRPLLDAAIRQMHSDAKQVVSEAIEALLVPKDGRDGKDGEPGKDGEKGDPGADGVGLAGAMIDREGSLVVTMTNGEVRSLGPVVGKEGAPGKDGLDGLGFDDLEVEQDDDGRVTLRFVRGDVKKEFALRFPVFVDRGTFKEGETYEPGNGVSWGGSFWIAQKDGALPKPGTGDDWRLAVKKGRDGRDGEKGERGEKGEAGRSWVKTDDLNPR